MMTACIPTSPLRIATVGTLAAALLILSGVPASAGEADVFPHAQHIEEGAECESCHEIPAAGAPHFVADACAECHDDDRAPPKAPRALRRLQLAFPHTPHVARLECKTCHAATLGGHPPGDQPVMGPERCLKCHAEQVAAPRLDECERCHGPDRRRTRPAYHRLRWDRSHGAFAQDSAMASHGRDCATCHRQSACRVCHQTRRPRSHTGLWRERAHGTAASWSRESCKTCHETGTCVGCHKRTQPRNHRGIWRITHSLVADSQRDPRCLTCHSASRCAACHRGIR